MLRQNLGKLECFEFLDPVNCIPLSALMNRNTEASELQHGLMEAPNPQNLLPLVPKRCISQHFELMDAWTHVLEGLLALMSP